MPKKTTKIKMSNTVKLGRGKTVISITQRKRIKIRPKKKG